MIKSIHIYLYLGYLRGQIIWQFSILKQGLNIMSSYFIHISIQMIQVREGEERVVGVLCFEGIIHLEVVITRMLDFMLLKLQAF